MNRTLPEVFRRFRYDLLALAVLAAVMALAVDFIPLQSVSGLIPLMGIVVSIFIGFRNRNAYSRWWEARTLWGGVVINGRSLHYALLAYGGQEPTDPGDRHSDGTPDAPEMTALADRLRRREVRHAWRLAAELRGRPDPPGLAELTPEDPADCTATELLRRQAVDTGELSRLGLIDRQARRVLVGINTAQVTTATGLERLRHQPIPRFYDLFIRALAWFFAIMVCTGLGGNGHDDVIGIVVGIMAMAVVVLAERIGHLLEEPMSDDIFGLPVDRFCAQLSADLLGPAPSGRVTGAGTVASTEGK